ncbi:hypothetical protein O7628_19730 [Micromonospora sp. WMMD956]|uniref:hypothetical protein n=1 Tax=Micromonospora sp. WMMD956 TaxID=3016108 RepID=UPI0024174816|nr:hypothetical protein [Micromonospora sp. WMMD956]MDG4817724.1 hypothetical protein [Micromonospora sp. WMMD956]
MYLTHLECPRCGRAYPAAEPQNLCACGSPLLARHDLAAVAAAVTPERLALRPADLWRYRKLLPWPTPGTSPRWARAGRRCCAPRRTGPGSASPT